MNPIALAIKTIVEAQGLTFLRTININDLNEQVGDVDLSGGAGIYTTVPDIDNLNFVGGQVVSNTPIEVYYLQLNDTVDDKGLAIDVILDALKPLADQFFDKIIKDPLVDNTQMIEGYQLSAVETIKFSKEVLTGWRLRVILPIDRKVYSCA